MIASHPQICLFQPEIPQNTGNIARLAAATQCRLHLVGPFGFDISDKQLRRPGLDYWPYLDAEIHDDLTSVLRMFHREQVAFLSTRGQASYRSITQDVELLVFGRETSGLPAELHHTYQDRFYSIPIYHPKVRSLNLANAVSIVVYDQIAKVDSAYAKRTAVRQ